MWGWTKPIPIPAILGWTEGQFWRIPTMGPHVASHEGNHAPSARTSHQPKPPVVVCFNQHAFHIFLWSAGSGNLLFWVIAFECGLVWGQCTLCGWIWGSPVRTKWPRHRAFFVTRTIRSCSPYLWWCFNLHFNLRWNLRNYLEDCFFWWWHVHLYWWNLHLWWWHVH